jgi:CheY-like chemotaxis protein
VLVIEDEPLVALELVSILEDAGAEVVGPIGLVEEAIETIASERLDAAFLDGNLHGHPVDDVASALTRAGTPFVFVSGYGRESLPAAFAHIEIVGKPFSPDHVLHASHSLLAERREATILRTRTKSA